MILDETVRQEKNDISQYYQIFPDEILGSGQFGIVYGGMQNVAVSNHLVLKTKKHQLTPSPHSERNVKSKTHNKTTGDDSDNDAQVDEELRAKFKKIKGQKKFSINIEKDYFLKSKNKRNKKSKDSNKKKLKRILLLLNGDWHPTMEVSY